ncbi:MAG: hypothetical protein ACRCZ2_02200 [Fusobacteriaceae bacterium]
MMINKLPENIIKEKLKLELTTTKYESPDVFKSYYKNEKGLSVEQLFEEHYTKFKPCLDEIKTFDKSNLISVAERKGFVVNDLRQLVTAYDKKLELQNNLLTEIQPDHICLPKISKFQKVLAQFEDPAEELSYLKDYFLSVENEVGECFRQNLKGYWSAKSFEINEDLNSAVNLLASEVAKWAPDHVEILLYYSEHFEKFSLVTLEPYLYALVGGKIFFAIFVPLHFEGMLHNYIKAVDKCQEKLRAKFPVHIRNSWLKLNLKKAYVSVKKIGFYLLTREPALVLGAICYINILIEARITSSSSGPFNYIAKSLPQEQRSFDNLFFQNLKNNMAKLFFEAGDFVGVVFKSFFEGILWGNKKS